MGDLPPATTCPAEAAITFRRDLVTKFQVLMLETRQDASDLLDMLLGLYYRVNKKGGKKPGRPPKYHKGDISKASDKLVGTKKSKRTGVKVNRYDVQQLRTESEGPLLEATKEELCEFPLHGNTTREEGQARFPKVATPVLLSSLPARRSSRKPSTPKRKIAESDNSIDMTVDIPVGEEKCISTPPAPKRRRKNKPQKLVRLSSGEDNSGSDEESVQECSEGKTENIVHSNQSQVTRERKSKLNAKSVIDEMTKNIFDTKTTVDDELDDKDVADDNGETDADWGIMTIEVEGCCFDDKDDDVGIDSDNIGTSGKHHPKPGRFRGSIKWRNDKTTYKCTLCQASFQRPAHLKRHMEGLHKKDSAFSCRGCGKSSSSELTRRYHEAYGCKLMKMPYRCELCSLGFDSEKELTEHKCSKDSSKPCICLSCDYKTGSPRDLEQHLRVHTGEKCFKCDQCEFATAWRKNLKEHMFKHTGLKPYVCDVCGFATNDRHNLRSHRTTHSAEKAFMCEICGDKFREPRFLKAHQIVHTNLKPYKCSQCNYSAKFKSCLRSHMICHTGVKKFVCEQCGQGFRTKSHMQTHQNNVHLYPDMMYGCKHCDYTANNSQSINSHMRKHTKKPRKQKQAKRKAAAHSEDANCSTELSSPELDNTKQKKEINIYRFEATYQDGGHSNVSSTGFDGLQTEGRQLEPTMTTINTQDLHELRETHQDTSVFSQLQATTGDVLAVLPCFNGDAPTSNQDGVSGIVSSDTTRPQYEELLYNSNTSQAETISAMMTLIREFRPR